VFPNPGILLCFYYYLWGGAEDLLRGVRGGRRRRRERELNENEGVEAPMGWAMFYMEVGHG
jgi:hypothetical protein